MSSRLDRLLLLLESGSTPVIRRSAAEQLGDVQKLYPHELENLLNKVHAYLMNSQWETRVAASQAVEAIIKNVEQWNPPGIPKGKDTQFLDTSNYLSLSAFDISRVLEGGVQLNMCDAKTFDLPVNPDDPVNQDVNNKERLMEQKQQLNKRLGLEMCNTLKIGPTDAFVTEEDFMVEEPTETPAQILSMNDFIKERLLANGEEGGLGGPMDSEPVATRVGHQSVKRKAEEPEEAQSSKRMKVEGATTSALEAPDGGNAPSTTTTTDSEEKQPRDWPLMSFSNLLSNNLFSQVWEKRHGSALGLKVLIKLHGRGAGRTADMSSHELGRANQKWLEDLCVRLMCVLALDRLGDFLSDEVVAPVRESCAQVVGVACLHLEPVGIVSVVRALLQLVNYPKDIWEVKHGGLLGIKYILAVRQDLTEQLLQETLPSVCRGLADNSDDVRSVAASALVPVTNALAKFSPLKALEIIDSLWNSLKELDDLTSSTNSVMTLLSLLVSHPDIYNKCQNDLLSTLVPLTWPFLGHNISSVRRATLLTLNTLLQKSLAMEAENNTSCHWLRPILSSMLRLVFQRSIIEHEPSILELVCQVWSSLLSCSDVPHLVSSVVPYFSSWMCLSMQPSSLPLDRNFLLILPSKGGEQVANDNNFLKDEIIYIGGISNIADSESEKDALVIRARLTATRLLGQLCHKIADRKKLSDVKTEKKDEVHPKDPPTPLDPNNPGMGYLEAVANDLGILFQVYLNSKSAVQRMTTAWVVKEWAEAAFRDKMHCECPQLLVDRLKTCLGDILYYDEIASKFTRLQTECRAFVASLLTWGAVLEKPFSDVGALLTLEQISQLCGVVSQRGLSLCHGGLTGQQESAYQKQKAELEANLSQVTAQQEVHCNRVQCSIASALVELRSYPDSLNPVIRPLMDCLKMEENSQLQERTAEVLSQVVEHHKDRTPCPSTKIVKNLCSMYCIDATIGGETWDKFNDIQVLKSRQQMASSWRPRKYGPHKKNKEELEGVEVTQNAPPLKDPNEVQKRGSVLALISITRRPGSNLPQWVPDLWKVMYNSLETFAPSALSSSVKVKDEPLSDSKTIHPSPPSSLASASNNGINIPPHPSSVSDTEAQDLLRSLTVLNLVAPHLDRGLQVSLIDHFPHFLRCIEHPYASVRHAAGRCLATVARLATEVTMETAVSNTLIPWLRDSNNDRRKMGAVEALSLIIEELNVALVPYLVSLVLPMLGAMSDSNPGIRLVATNSFATLVRLMPLDKSLDVDNKLAMSHCDPQGQSAPSEVTKVVKVNKQQERDQMFLEQLLNPKLIEDFQIPIKLKVDLRRYQQDGVNWLSFLSRYKLHGILCDDMGLGKTLQSLCIIVADHYSREQACKDKLSDEQLPISLVVCPPTLTAHWLYEVEKVVPSDIIRPLHYVGSPSERARLQKYVAGSNLVLASYDVVRNDIDFFSKIKWNYCILDEGHVIKNNKTKLSKAIKQLQCCHRLILSGTPIQNNVLELWSLFDFLMPGYLGTEKQFQLTFGRPILASRDARSSSKEQEAGTLALEALHRQVLPFMLRRLKEDVLKDLPPKIITDYYCDLSQLQVKLYEDYSKQHMDKIEVATTSNDDDDDDDAGRAGADNDAGSNGAQIPAEISSPTSSEGDGKRGKRKEKVSHIFQALQYLRKVCNHPMLAMNRHDDDSLREIHHTSKLVALKQLLNDCGIGLSESSASVPASSSSSSSSADPVAVPVVSQHRVILFCQMKIMLDIIERDLFKRHMSTVTYLRLDGSIPAVNRLQIVHRFNNDPSIDVLLLTTQVGGLGLNLTGADTVVFYDHDWNPMKDLQAMDRAHRIGQKKVVTVYRLITRGTLEEKIMGLQKFKMNVAQSVVNQDNHSLASMCSNQLLDLFCLDKNARKISDGAGGAGASGSGGGGGGGGGRGIKSMLEDLENLWDENQYGDEYDVDAFVRSLD